MIVRKVGDHTPPPPPKDGSENKRKVTGIEERVPPGEGDKPSQPSSSGSSGGSQKNQMLGNGQQATTEDHVTIRGGDGNDVINVTQDKDGNLRVDVNGKVETYTREQARGLVIEGGAGDDKVLVDKGVTYDLTLDGGDGNDEIHGGSGKNTIYGGLGNDKLVGGSGGNVIDGGFGRDYIAGGKGDDTLTGGKQDDVIYGLGGNDVIDGGAGNDYLDGGVGNDTIRGGDGNDMIFGGRGDDILEGGKGTNVMAGGDGKDTIKSAGVKDKVYSQSDDTVVDDTKPKTFWEKITAFFQGKQDKTPVTTDVPIDNSLGTNIQVNGSDEFKARVNSDMDALRSTPTGKKMLESLRGSSHTIDIQETGEPNNMVTYEDSLLRDDGTRGPGADVTVNYNPSRVTLGYGTSAWEQRPPVVGLYHELAHSYNAVTGTTQKGTDSTGAPNLEDQAIGIPNSGIPYDHDLNPATPQETGNPASLTENALRSELGLAKRPIY